VGRKVDVRVLDLEGRREEEMVFTRRGCGYVVGLLCLVRVVPGLSAGLSPDEAVHLIADYLVQNQVSQGPDEGTWPDELDFLGPTTSGMADAYDWTGAEEYHFRAESAAHYLLHAADEQGNLLGDEAYAIVRMSQVSGFVLEGPYWDYWWAALAEFYHSLRREGYEGSTQVYLHWFDDLDPSINVFYFAHHVVAAYYVDDIDKELWRDALIAELSRVDDMSAFPVMALGTATWALAEIDHLDDTAVTLDANSPCWGGVVLRDLPALLLTHQVPEGEFYSGSFYWRFDHLAEGSRAGYTEDAVYGTRGLAAAASLEVNLQNKDMEQALTRAEQALLQGIDPIGAVYEHLSQQGEMRYAFCGEMLEALWSVKQYRAAQADSLATDGESAGEAED